ncbi:MAG: hypothetical protein PHY72_03975 [Candidatus Pacebacteria bacterium]|nr:hypothetical protein [Candidatus Paceibacterota bacterium]
MDNDFNKELIEYLDEKFNKSDLQFEKIDKQFDGVNRQFEAIEERFDKIDQKFVEQKKEFNSLQVGVDAYAHKADAFFQELVMLGHQYNRHEKWIQMLAEKLNVKLEY